MNVGLKYLKQVGQVSLSRQIHSLEIVGAEPTLAIFGLTKITYGDIGKGSFTHYRHRSMVNSSKTDIPKSQKDLFRTGNEVNPVRK